MENVAYEPLSFENSDSDSDEDAGAYEWLYHACESPITECKRYNLAHGDFDMKTGERCADKDTLAGAWLSRAEDYGLWYYQEVFQHPKLQVADRLCAGKVKSLLFCLEPPQMAFINSDQFVARGTWSTTVAYKKATASNHPFADMVIWPVTVGVPVPQAGVDPEDQTPLPKVPGFFVALLDNTGQEPTFNDTAYWKLIRLNQ